ncbi:hypothetical protein K0M31_008190 [Melipona bicolor]|uniref:Uncharacterized protein n=1 Tax=Melipona bicolor TaxID=60889 RepID=A0AA40FR58_9HYME|nr:hypothetical protein K0M31_008190 [Melipona bicolor]
MSELGSTRNHIENTHLHDDDGLSNNDEARPDLRLPKHSKSRRQQPLLVEETANPMFDEIIAEVPLVLRWFPAQPPPPSPPETSKSYKRRKSDGRLEEGNRRRKGRDVALGGKRSFAILPKLCASVCTVVMGCQKQTFAARALYTNTITLLLGRFLSACSYYQPL